MKEESFPHGVGALPVLLLLDAASQELILSSKIPPKMGARCWNLKSFIDSTKLFTRNSVVMMNQRE
jgi:hypothetical protein